MKIPAIKGFDQDALNKYFKNTGWLMLGRVGSMAIKMLISIQVANYLLPAGNGMLGTSVAYIYLFAALASLGLDSFIVKELHQYPKKQRYHFRHFIFAKNIGGITLFATNLYCLAIFFRYRIFPTYLFSFYLLEGYFNHSL